MRVRDLRQSPKLPESTRRGGGGSATNSRGTGKLLLKRGKGRRASGAARDGNKSLSGRQHSRNMPGTKAGYLGNNRRNIETFTRKEGKQRVLK